MHIWTSVAIPCKPSQRWLLCDSGYEDTDAGIMYATNRKYHSQLTLLSAVLLLGYDLYFMSFLRIENWNGTSKIL